MTKGCCQIKKIIGMKALWRMQMNQTLLLKLLETTAKFLGSVAVVISSPVSVTLGVCVMWCMALYWPLGGGGGSVTRARGAGRGAARHARRAAAVRSVRGAFQPPWKLQCSPRMFPDSFLLIDSPMLRHEHSTPVLALRSCFNIINGLVVLLMVVL